MSTRTLTDEQVRNLRQQRANGAKLGELAERYGISVARVSTIATGGAYTDAGGPLTRLQRKASEVVEDALWLLDSGEHPAHVADRLGMDIEALDKALGRAGRRRPDVMAEAKYRRRLVAA